MLSGRGLVHRGRRRSPKRRKVCDIGDRVGRHRVRVRRLGLGGRDVRCLGGQLIIGANASLEFPPTSRIVGLGEVRQAHDLVRRGRIGDHHRRAPSRGATNAETTAATTSNADTDVTGQISGPWAHPDPLGVAVVTEQKRRSGGPKMVLTGDHRTAVPYTVRRSPGCRKHSRPKGEQSGPDSMTSERQSPLTQPVSR